MENNSSYSDMKIDQQAAAYLLSAAKWNTFISIIGFVCCGFMILGGLTLLFIGSALGTLGRGLALGAMGGSLLGLIYLVVAGIYLVPCLYLYNFASKMQAALQRGDQALINPAFANFKAYSKFVGILVIVCIGIAILSCLLFPVLMVASTL